MKFFQKTGVAVAITVLAIAAALFIGLSPVLKSGAETAPVQTVSSQDTSAQTSSASPPASEQTASGTAGDETISNKYIRDEAGLFTRSAENTIKDYNDKIYSKTGSHVAILTTADTGGMSLESYTNSAFDAMGLSEYDMLFSVDTDTQTWYVTTGAYVADFADSWLEDLLRSPIVPPAAETAVHSLMRTESRRKIAPARTTAASHRMPLRCARISFCGRPVCEIGISGRISSHSLSVSS